MPANSLKTRIFGSLLAVIFALAAPIAVLGYFAIDRDIIGQIEDKVNHDIEAARMVWETKLADIGRDLKLSAECTGAPLAERLEVDYVVRVERDDFESIESEIAAEAIRRGEATGGARLIGIDELKELGSDAADRVAIEMKPTAMARPSNLTVLKEALAIEYAMCVKDDSGSVEAVTYAGKVINGDSTLADRIRLLVFGSETYGDKPIGTVTIFQDDVRVATNVLNDEGKRAIGTRVSEQVYRQVVEHGRRWHDRAFVVTDWYKTAYEPIRDIRGKIIGILYVGILEQPLKDRARQLTMQFLAVVASAVLLTIVLSLVLAGAISRPLTRMLKATVKLSNGELGCRVSQQGNVAEINTLTEAFNEMSVKLDERDRRIRESNEKLIESNKRYVDLIGFVAHELKGILASAVLNAYSVRDGYLGLINFKQRRAMDSVTRNLDYLAATVRKFLNLGRIERGELSVNRTELNLRKDVFEMSLESLSALTARNNVTIINEIDGDMVVEADSDLMQIVANNLVSNAVKYCTKGGTVKMTSRKKDGCCEVEVYNDSEPISEEQKGRLFEKFHRLDNKQTKTVKGTGLGLYITKQIIESHGGRIWVEARAKGNSFIFEVP